MDIMKKTFCAFVGHERYKCFWGIFTAIVGVPPSSFVIMSCLLTSLRKDYSYVDDSSATETAVLLDLDIRLPASRRILMRN